MSRPSLLTAVRAETRRRKTGGRPCGFKLAVGRLSRRDRQELEQLMADRSVSTPAIRAVLMRRGVPKFSESTFYNHRRRECLDCYGWPE